MKFANCRRLYQITAILVLMLFYLPAMASDKKPSGKKVAVVNGVVISRTQYDKELDVHRERISRQGKQISDDQMAELKKDILEGLIEREVLYQESQKAGIKIADQKVNDQLANIKKRFPNEEEFKKALASMDLTEEEVRAQIQRGLAIRELIDEKVASKIAITDEETNAYYTGNPQLFKQPEKVKASHILIKVEPTADDAKKAEAGKKIEEIQQKLKEGGDFAQLAKEYSEGPSSTKGGDLGYFQRGQMVKPFEDTAFSMKANEVSGRVETRFGYHLIKVYDKKPEQTLSYADVKDKIAQRLKQEKVEKDATQYVENLKKDAKVEKLL
ncbi:MAG: peptidylprolyl isomerase [Desulfobacterales bacterium]